jgi:hypothetical protein
MSHFGAVGGSLPKLRRKQLPLRSDLAPGCVIPREAGGDPIGAGFRFVIASLSMEFR